MEITLAPSSGGRWTARFLLMLRGPVGRLSPNTAQLGDAEPSLGDQPLRRFFRVLRCTTAFLIGAGSSSSWCRSMPGISAQFWHADGTTSSRKHQARKNRMRSQLATLDASPLGLTP